MGRVERAILLSRQRTAEQDLFADSAALNLHDFYSALERIFEHIASDVDRSVPTGRDWHRELLRQMVVEIQGLRPQVITTETASAIDAYLRFRHVVRNVYAFEFDPTRIERLANSLRPAFERARGELLDFASFLDGLAQEG